MNRRSVRGWASILVVISTVLLTVGIVAGTVALITLNSARTQLVEQIDPQLSQSSVLTDALLNQETGIRGYLLTGQQDFLQPYQLGVQQQGQAVTRLRELGATPGTKAGENLDQVLDRASNWQRTIAAPTVADRKSVTPAQTDLSRGLFDQVRAALTAEQDNLEQARQAASANLADAGTLLDVVFVAIAALLIILFVLLYVAFRRVFVNPVVRLAGEVQTVANEDIHRTITGSGPKELMELAEHTEAMRHRIVDEVAELKDAQVLIDARSAELERSNSDLEQFAYVASHDLQEPLRKVTSFCQLLQRRYAEQLDERGNVYIEFAVDGAKRMQVLINDLLAFSRVGRRGEDHSVVDTRALLEQAITNLEEAISESGATVVYSAEDLPQVLGSAPLLTGVFQNLIGNAVKFRGESVPSVRVEVREDGTDWLFSVTDNGIGIETEYADRIFVIFQRLHAKDAYPGTGIGLAMCRKIIEYHGGQIWLDTSESEGVHRRFCFTLPALAGEQQETLVAVPAGSNDENEDA